MCFLWYRRCFKKISPCLSCYSALNFVTWFQIFFLKKNIYESFAIVRKWNSRKAFLILSHFHAQPVQNMRNKYLPDAFFLLFCCLQCILCIESSRHMLLLNIAHDSIFEWKVIYERAKNDFFFVLISPVRSIYMLSRTCVYVDMFVNYCSEWWRQKKVYTYEK